MAAIYSNGVTAGIFLASIRDALSSVYKIYMALTLKGAQIEPPLFELVRVFISRG
jgi:hypothetical protein